MQLYHGSKSGLSGQIRPASRSQCDFGSGFYLDTHPEPTCALVCSYDTAKIYTLELDLTGLKILNLPATVEWALLIAYFRGKLESIKDSKLYKHYSTMADEYDVICGLTADDRIFSTLKFFFDGFITDTVLLKALSALDFGTQYVAKTQKACDAITVNSFESFPEAVRMDLIEKNKQLRLEAIRLTNEIRQNSRREGHFFDEILKSGV
ncbi:MAG: DUF3990 domain-containing protein [Christensenellaceae bacterium]|jgi:hypothetical protein|nr:DUF3990 domain-containing protein [Christensenellaceae bacterium]